MIYDLTKTELWENEREWWSVRAWIIALDRDVQNFELTVRQRISLRRN